MGYLFLIVAGWATYGLFRMVRDGNESRRYLAASAAEPPLKTGHLAPPLARLVADTRLLRISLEAPVLRVKELRAGDLDTASTEDLDAFDNMLMNLSRQIADWLHAVDRLPPAEKASMQDLGLGPEALRTALENEGWSFDRRNLRGPGKPMDERLQHVIMELHRVETMLQTTRRPYR
ncbi:MAG: hypothetical protein K0V04_36365 [Deltaproteobacteria bacterium]|nr:hypothetical protein [Deltaproteobacteria bacterium]